MDSLAVLRETFGDRLREQEPMSRHTNFRIGGPARYFVDATTPDEIEFIVRVAGDFEFPWFVIGGGSNTLVADNGFDGFVIRMANRDIRVEGSRVIAGAGAITSAVARAAGEAGLTGFEWAVSLPGTIGGAVRGNAGCFGGEMKDVVEFVSIFSPSGPSRARDLASLEEGERERLSSSRRGGAGGGGTSVQGVGMMTNPQCGFEYRHSTFKNHSELVIINVTLQLRFGDAAASSVQMDEYLAKRRTKQPLERPSAGCLFKNVELRDLDAQQRDQLDRATDGAWRTVAHDEQIPSGWLIERAGCKGLRIGDAMVSEQHGNFVINLGNATAADVIAISDAVRARIRDQFGLNLHEEVQRVGF